VGQQTLAMQNGFEQYARKSRRELFLEEMERIIPWTRLTGLIQPHYPKGENGRPPVGLERMLRLCFLQQWFNLSDRGLEEALYESLALRRFAGIDLGKEPAPDETTICKFRHLLEEHDPGQAMLREVNAHLAAHGVKIARGTIVDATIIHAPSSTSNEKRERDPEMHQVRKGKQWYFGMKAHVGVDSRSGTVHTAVATAANTSDSRVLERGTARFRRA
jgi:transposase, IS5 family